METIERWEPPSTVNGALLPAIRSDAQEIARRLATPTDRDFIEKCLITLSHACAYRQSMNEKEAGAKLKTYSALLSEYPAECIAEGCRRYAVSETWFPALAELLRYIDPIRGRMRADLAKLRLLEDLAGKAKAQDDGSKWGPIGDDMRSKVTDLVARLRKS